MASTSGSSDRRINLDEALGIYEAWKQQAAAKGEKAALKRLYPSERVAIQKIAEFIKQGVERPANAGTLTLEARDLSLLERLGIEDFSPITAVGAIAAFRGALDAVKGKMNENVPPSLFEREQFFDHLLAEMKQDPILSDSRVQEMVHTLMISLRGEFLFKSRPLVSVLAVTFASKFGENINFALARPASEKTVRSVAKTVSTLSPILKREGRVGRAVSIAESYENRDVLLSAFNKIYDRTEVLTDKGKVKSSLRTKEEEQLIFLETLSSYAKGNISVNEGENKLSPEEKAFLSTRWAQEEIATLIEKAKTDSNIDLKAAFVNIVTKADRQDWIDRSGFVDTGFVAFTLNYLSRKILQAVFPDSFVDKLTTSMENVRLSSVTNLNSKANWAGRAEAKLMERMGQPDAKFETDLKRYLAHVGETGRKYAETERRISQNLKSPFYQGLYAKTLYEHHAFLVNHFATALAIEQFLQIPKEEIQNALESGKTVSSIVEQLRQKELENLSEGLAAKLNRAKFWAESSDSYEGKMVLARIAIDQANWQSDPIRVFNNIKDKADDAIKSAQNLDVWRFPSFAPFLKAFGYAQATPQRARLAEAMQLKIEVCQTAYAIALEQGNNHLAGYSLGLMLTTAEEKDAGHPTPLFGITREILAASKMEGNELLGWLFGHDLKNPDVSDRSLESLSRLFVVSGIDEAADRIVALLQAEQQSGKALTDMDIQNLMTIALVRKDLRGTILKMVPENVRRVLDELRKPEPSVEALGNGYLALSAAATYLTKTNQLDHGVFRLLEKVALEGARLSIEKVMKEVEKTPTPAVIEGFFQQPFRVALKLCQENPQIAAPYLLRLIEIGKEQKLPYLSDVKNAFIEVMRQKEGGTWTSEEVKGVVTVALGEYEHTKARNLLVDQSEHYPLAAWFVTDPLLAYAAAPKEKADSSDLTRSIMGRMVSNDDVSRFRAYENEMPNLDAHRLELYRETPDALLFFLYRANVDKHEGEKALVVDALKQFVAAQTDISTLKKIAEAEERLRVDLGATTKLSSRRPNAAASNPRNRGGGVF